MTRRRVIRLARVTAASWRHPPRVRRPPPPEKVEGAGTHDGRVRIAGGSVAELRGFRRGWQVAMDNTRDRPGYKHYVAPETGERPALYVAYLDLVPDPETTVNGVVFALDVEPLKALDSRERNYERHEMTQRMEPAVEGRVWVYLGTGAARERFERGRASGTAVINRPY